jgi:hypothetical protein
MKGCNFYGYCPHPKLGLMLETGGNQCGLISEAFAPCRMEMRGQSVDFQACELRGTGRALEYETFERDSVIRDARPQIAREGTD